MLPSPPPFTDYEIAAMKALLADPAPAYASDSLSVRGHVEHCLWQTARFAHLAACGLPFRAAQWGLNFGRAQELLKSHGGLGAWWRAFEPLIEAQNWTGLKDRSILYLELLELPLPGEEFISRA